MTKQIKVTGLENGNTYAYHNGMIVEIMRHGNDVNGNPLYKVFPVSHLFRRSELATRNYNNSNKPYWLVQSYNIHSDVVSIIDDIVKNLTGGVNEPMGEEWYFITYQY